MDTVIYTTPGCPRCRLTLRQFDKHGRPYRQVTATPKDIEQLRAEGFTSFPVVKTPSESWDGFRPEKIGAVSRPRDVSPDVELGRRPRR